ncbi:hypothetical protein AYX15_07078 [Cryptococcus neoformans]|nr:hypothetical protein AYX15_07078 [Cryptococcus neoformans var. grubii]
MDLKLRWVRQLFEVILTKYESDVNLTLF